MVKTKKARRSIIVYNEDDKDKVAMAVLIRNEPGCAWAVEGMGWIDPGREGNKKT